MLVIIDWRIGALRDARLEPCGVVGGVERERHLEGPEPLRACGEAPFRPEELCDLASLAPIPQAEPHRLQTARPLVPGEGGSARHGGRV